MKSGQRAWLFVFACSMGMAGAHAQTGAAGVHECAPEIVALIGKPAGAATNGKLVTGVCKAWPGKAAHTIAALAYDDGRERDKPLVVALVDASRSAVVARYDGLLEEDAMLTVGPGSLGIDTARYQLAPGVRAFGLDISTSYSQGCGDGGVGPARTLFVQEGKRLRPVLINLYLSVWHYVRGGPSCVDARDDDLIETVSYSIGIGKAVHHGFASLRVTATSDLAATRPRSVDVHYNGQAYDTSGVDWNR